MPALPMRVPLSMVSVAAIIAIVLTVFGVTVAVMRKARMASDERKTLDNLKECANGVHLAHDNNKKFPPYYGIYGAAGGKPATFHTHLERYVYQYANFEPERARQLQAGIVPEYLAPQDSTRRDGGANATNFPVNLRLYYTEGGLGTLSSGASLIYPRMPNTFQGRGTLRR